MTDTLISQLLDFGALGAFSAFLVYLYFGMQKRMDKLVESFQAQLKDIESRHEERIEKIRARYDQVIEAYRAEAKECHEMMAECKAGIAAQMQESNVKLESVAEDVRTGLGEMREHYKDMEILAAARKLANKEKT